MGNTESMSFNEIATIRDILVGSEIKVIQEQIATLHQQQKADEQSLLALQQEMTARIIQLEQQMNDRFHQIEQLIVHQIAQTQAMATEQLHKQQNKFSSLLIQMANQLNQES